MTWISTTTSICLATFLAAGQIAAQQISTVPSYLPGRQYELRLMMSTEDVRDTPPRKTYETPVTLRVIRTSTAGTDLDWIAGKSVGASAAERADPILEMAERIFENLHLRVHLDAAGRYQGLGNEVELKEKGTPLHAATVVGDTFLRIPIHPMDSIVVQVCTNITEVDMSAAISGDSELVCIDLDLNGTLDSYAYFVFGDHILNPI